MKGWISPASKANYRHSSTRIVPACMTPLKSEQQDLNLRPHGPQPCALPNYAMLRICFFIVTDLYKKFNPFLYKVEIDFAHGKC